MDLSRDLLRDIILWDVRNWSKALNFWSKKMIFENGQKGLELGGREGGLSLWLALNGVDTICSDIGENVELTAAPLHRKHRIFDKIKYETIDASQIPYENEFDVIVFKSIIGGVGYGDNYGRQQEAFRQIYKALKPGGKLLFAENLVASPLHKYARRRFTKWGESWRYLTNEEMTELLSPFGDFEIKKTGFAAAFGRTESQRSLLGSADKVLNLLVPGSWKYICYGIATK